jgi:hypothetical protein
MNTSVKSVEKKPCLITPRREPKTIVIGTSHVRNIGLSLNKKGVDCVSFTNGGCSISHILPRMKNMIPNNFQGNIVVQVGGNDLLVLKTDTVIHDYECFIQEIFCVAPSSQIYTCAVPPRLNGDRDAFNSKRLELNKYLLSTSSSTTNISFINCPVRESPRYFRRDGVHFNKRGFSLYINNLVSSLSQDFHMHKKPKNPH